MNRSSFSVGVVMDPIAYIKPAADTSLALMLAAQARGATLFYMEQDDLFLKDGKAYATARPVTVFDDARHWYEVGEAAVTPLGSLDFIFMRKDPPVDKRFIHACAMLDQARRDGARVVNDPGSLMLYNEKLLATHFPQFCPPFVVASAYDVLRDFHREHGKIVLKPLDGMGGQGIFMVDAGDVNFDVIWETQTGRGAYPVVAQAFLPAIADGDMRVVVIDGEPFGHMLARFPKDGSIRGNLAAGGRGEVVPLGSREREIAETVGAGMREIGVTLAGLDMIGGFLTEVNITSPTGLRPISKAAGVDLAGMVVDGLFRS